MVDFLYKAFQGLLLVLSLSCSVSFANSIMPLGPSGCPNVAAIKGAGIEMMESDGPGKFTATTESNFGTKTTWGFVIAGIKAPSAVAAHAIAVKDLAVLTGSPSAPIYDPSSQYWICPYNQTAQGNFTGTLTPVN